MGKVLLPVLALAAVILQTTVVARLSVAGAAPDLVFLTVLGVVLQRSSTLGLWIGFGLGWMQDAAGGGALGLNALLLAGVAYLAGRLRQRLFKENVSAQLLLVFLFTFLHQFLLFFGMNTLLSRSFGLGEWVGRTLGKSAYHMLLAPFWFFFLGRLLPGENVYRHFIRSRVQPGGDWRRGAQP